MTSGNNADKNLEKWTYWSAIASSIAAIVSLLLFGYQLITDRADLRIDLKGAAWVDYSNYQSSYIAVWIDAFNQGKRPIGIIEAKLNLNFSDRTKTLLDEIPIFPRFNLNNKSNAPCIEQPFFYDPQYFDNFVKDKSGEEKPFDYHPKELNRENRILDVGSYRLGYIIFKLEANDREKFLHETDKSELNLFLFTTNGKKTLKIKNINRWKPETFGKRFFIIVPEADKNQ